MTLACALKTFLFSVFLFFYQQGQANDTYGLEEFRHHQKTKWKPPSEKQQNGTGQPSVNPLENIRIGFARLNLESDDLSGDDRLETCEGYQVSEQDFERLHSLYLNYVNTGDPQNQKVRIQSMLTLLHRMFAININVTNGKNQTERFLIRQMANRLYSQFFWSEYINGRSNPYYDYFYIHPKLHKPNYTSVNNGLALMLFAFLAPHFIGKLDLYIQLGPFYNLYTGEIYDQAFDRGLLSENINEYHSPQSLANQLNAAGLGAETALLIGLTAMASAAFQRMDSGLQSQETLKTLLTRCLPFELLAVVYNNIAKHCQPGRSCCVPGFMYSRNGMEVFTHSIVGINPVTQFSVPSLPEGLHYLINYIERSAREAFVRESYSQHQHLSTVVQQQNELIAQLRRESANQTSTEEAGAVGGASGESRRCPICTNSTEEIMLLQPCGHGGFCKNCAVRILDEQRSCPFCRQTACSYIKVIDKSLHK